MSKWQRSPTEFPIQVYGNWDLFIQKPSPEQPVYIDMVQERSQVFWTLTPRFLNSSARTELQRKYRGYRSFWDFLKKTAFCQTITRKQGCQGVVRNFRSFLNPYSRRICLDSPPPPLLTFLQKKDWWASQCIVQTWTPIQASCRATRRLHSPSPLPPAWQLTALCSSSYFSWNYTCDAFS